MSLEVSSLRAVAHPLRLRILSLLTGVEMSAAEVARELGMTQANASYHLRVLAASGYVVEAGTEKIRGGVAKRYAHPWKTSAHRRVSADPAGGHAFVASVADELVRRAADLVPDARTLVADAEVWVAPDVWEQALEHVQRASALVHDNARRPRSEGATHVSMTAAMFEMKAAR
jgi:DNA-binding transcriptional ArsR family regulator